MALKVIKLDPFKRGDTPSFEIDLSAPYAGFSWSGVTADVALTSVAAPTNNTGAGMYRPGMSVVDNGDGTAYVLPQLTVLESNALTPNTTYKLELQLKDNGGANVATATTATVLVEQDYVI